MTFLPPAYTMLWTLSGLCLTIVASFVGLHIVAPPWEWWGRGIGSLPLNATAQVAAVMLASCLGGARSGLWAQIGYLTIGLLTPFHVFQIGGGWDAILQPTFGYLLGFLPGAWACGWLAMRRQPTIDYLVFCGLVGTTCIHACGSLYLFGWHLLNLNTVDRLPFWQLFADYSIFVLPGQFVAVCIAATIAASIRKLMFY
jgi:biotin transport system substrate-specific component